MWKERHRYYPTIVGISLTIQHIGRYNKFLHNEMYNSAPLINMYRYMCSYYNFDESWDFAQTKSNIIVLSIRLLIVSRKFYFQWPGVHNSTKDFRFPLYNSRIMKSVFQIFDQYIIYCNNTVFTRVTMFDSASTSPWPIPLRLGLM
jgi:hypothetical protein